MVAETGDRHQRRWQPGTKTTATETVAGSNVPGLEHQRGHLWSHDATLWVDVAGKAMQVVNIAPVPVDGQPFRRFLVRGLPGLPCVPPGSTRLSPSEVRNGLRNLRCLDEYLDVVVLDRRLGASALVL